MHCPQESHRDGASWTRVPLDCRERSPSSHHTSTLGKRALEETPRVIQLQQFQERQFSYPSALGVLPATAKSGKAMPWWEWRNCPPFVKMQATIAAQGLPSLLQSCSLWSHFSETPLHLTRSSRLLRMSGPQYGTWQQAETTLPQTHPVSDLCYSHPSTYMELKRKNLLCKANHVRKKGSLEDKGKEQNKMRV